MRLVNSMSKDCVFGGASVVGRMRRLRPPAAPARLVLMGPLLILFFLQNTRLGSSLDNRELALDRFSEETNMGKSKLLPGYQKEEKTGDLHSSVGVGSWTWRGFKIRRLIQLNQETGTDGPLPSGNQVSPSPNNSPPAASPSNSPPTTPNSPPTTPAPQPSGTRTSNSGKLDPKPPKKSPSAADTPKGDGNSSSKKRLLILIPVIALAAAAAFAVILVLFLRHNKVKTVKPWKTGLSGQLQKALVTGVPQLKRSEVETACESFSNIIGSLSDGTVYKGTLSSGVEIAVSVIKTNKHWPAPHKTQFKKKITMLSRVNHKNFVNLIGYCEENDPFTRMLIFEYAPNGTLFEHLHIRESQDLSWSSRLRIAVGVAFCLDFMHQLNPPIILKNLDSNVIYLTDDFAAKIADMELWSKTAEGGNGTRTPENLQHEMPDKESIVHKFGIVLLELLSGRPPYSDENYGLVSWASDYLKGGKPLKEMIDPQLIKVREEDAKSLFEVIKSCLKPNPSERPTMSEVAAQLKVITGISPEGAAPRLSPLWWAELEIISTEAT